MSTLTSAQRVHKESFKLLLLEPNVNLNFLTSVLNDERTTSDQEIDFVVSQIQLNQSDYLDEIRTALVTLTVFIKSLLKTPEANEQLSLCDLLELSTVEEKKLVRDLLVSPITIALSFSYPAPKRKKEKSKKNNDVSDGSLGKEYYRHFYQCLPYFNTDSSLGDENDLVVAKFLFHKFVMKMEKMISLVGSENRKLLHQRMKLLTSATGEGKLEVAISKSDTNGGFNESCIEEKINQILKYVFIFLCETLIEEPENNVNIVEELFGNEDENIIKSFQLSGNNKLSKSFRNIVLRPDNRVKVNIIGSSSVFNKKSKDLPFYTIDKLYKNISKVEICLTAFAAEVKKELFTQDVIIGHEELLNVEPSEVKLNLNSGLSVSEIEKYPKFLRIMQQGVKYLIGSQEILFNRAVFGFIHKTVLHIGVLAIELDRLSFTDHKTKGRKVVKLAAQNKLPVTFKCYPLESIVTENIRSKVSLQFNGMISLISLMHTFTEQLKSVKSIKDTHSKMCALRDALKKPTMGTIPEANENDDDSDGSSQKSGSNSDEERHQYIDGYKSANVKEKGGSTSRKDSDDEMKDSTHGDTYMDSITAEENSDDAGSIFSAKEQSDPSSAESTFGANVRSLVLVLKKDGDGMFKYVRDPITLYTEDDIFLTSIRYFSLEQEFNISVYERDLCMSSVWFIPLHVLVQGLVDSIELDATEKKKRDLEEIINKCKTWNVEQVALKYYSPINVKHKYHNDLRYGEIESDLTFSDYSKGTKEKYYLNELKCFQKINNYNTTLENENPLETIAIPKLLLVGDHLEVQLGNFGDYEDMGFFFINEKLPSDLNLDECPLLSEEVITDACHQITNMIIKVGIRHNDLKLSNLCFYNARIFFLDFGNSYILNNVEEQLQEMVNSDVAELEHLLRNMT